MTIQIDENQQAAADLIAGITNADISRRNMLRGLFMGLGAASLPSWILQDAVARALVPGGSEMDIPFGPLGGQDFGPLVQQVVVDDLTSVNHQLFAPVGFNVRVVMRAGVNPVTKTAAGTLGHVNPDGGALYSAPDGGVVYVSNSETTPGSVSALRLDASGAVVDYYRICTNTRNNCAGGQTPWGTWITCEEVTGGYAYECDPFGSPATQRRLDALGARNGREAVAIDPINQVIYQTLDSSSGKFVRFVSNDDDLEVTPDGTTRMRMLSGETQRLHIPAFGDLPGYSNMTVPNNATESARLRPARPIEWLPDVDTNGTNFNGGEGIWYYEVPPELATVPTAGTLPTRGVMFFASKGDNRIWAIDIDNNLIELIYDIQNNQSFTNLRNMNGAPSNFNQVDNVVVGPGGDVLVAEDGNSMRLAIMFNDQPAKLLMQITRGGSEITGPAFTPDGSKLYFSSQRGPSGVNGTSSSGTTYEMTIPPQFRAVQRADSFWFQKNLKAAPSSIVSSDLVTIDGFYGPLVVSISAGNSAEFSVDDGPWTTVPTSIVAGQAVRVRHLSSPTVGQAIDTTLSIGLGNGLSDTSSVFRSVTSNPDAVPSSFNFGEEYNVPGNTLIPSRVLTLTGFNVPVAIVPADGQEYRVDAGAWMSEPGSLSPGQTLQVRHVSGAAAHAVVNTKIAVGGVLGNFRTRTIK